MELANFNALVAIAEICYTTCPFMGRLAWAEKLKELKCDIFLFGGSQTLSQVAPTKVNAKGVKRPAHYRRNVEAEIAAEQSSKEPAIRKKPFARLAKETLLKVTSDESYKLTPGAIQLLQHSAEARAVKIAVQAFFCCK